MAIVLHPILLKSKGQLYKECARTDSTAPEREQALIAMMDLMLDNLGGSLNRNSASTDRLTNVLTWLTGAVAGVLVVSVYIAFLK
jgi:hypothetical protein